MAREIRIKRGEALLLQLTFLHDDGITPVDLTTVTLAGQVRDPVGGLVATLPIVVSATQEGVALVTVADTSQWPLGMVRGDVRATAGGLPQLSDTFGIRVNRAVTQ